MLRLLCGFGVLLALPGVTSFAYAQYGGPAPAYYPSPLLCGGYPPGPRVAPDMCGPYFYCSNGCQWYGPSYCVRPPFEPFNGIIPGKPLPNNMPTPAQFIAQQAPGYGPQPVGQAPVGLPYNPFARSPRDYFMWNEAQRELYTRESRPRFVP
jgi:hypothetical protein